MAGPFLQGVSATFTGGSVETLDLPALTSAASGATFVVHVNSEALVANGNRVPVDNKSNTFTVTGAQTNSSGAILSTTFYAVENGAGGSNHVITIRSDAVGTPRALTGFAVEVRGVLTSGAKDQDAAPVADTTSPYSTNVTSATTQANEVALACVITLTGAAGPENILWQEGFQPLLQLSDGNFGTGAVGYRVLNAAGPVRASFLSSGASTSEAISYVVAYKLLASAGVAPRGDGPPLDDPETQGFLSLLDAKGWTGIDLDVGHWVADELTTSTGSVSNTVTLTGVAATGAVGAPIASVTVTVLLAGVAGTGSVSAPSVKSEPTVALAGVSGSSAVSAPSLIVDETVALSGVQGTCSTGSPAGSVAVAVAIGGVAGTGSVATPSVSSDPTVALGSVQATGAVGQLGYAEDGSIVLTGVGSTGQAGSPAVAVDVAITITGVQGVGQASAPSASSNPTVLLTGVEATGAVTAPAVAGDRQVTVTGVEATGAVGSPTPSVSVAIELASVTATGVAAAPTASTGETASLTGVEATGAANAPSAAVSVSVALTGVQAVGSANSPTARVDDAVLITGVQGSGAVGTVSAKSEPTVTLTGVEGVGEVGSPEAQGNSSVDGSTTLDSVAAAGSAGTAVAHSEPTIAIGAVQGAGSPGSLTCQGEAIVAVAGVSATGDTSAPAASTQVQAALTGVAAVGQVGTVVGAAATDATVTLVGVGATAFFAAPAVAADAVAVQIDGVAASGDVGRLGVPSGAEDSTHSDGVIYIADRTARTHATVELEGVGARAVLGQPHIAATTPLRARPRSAPVPVVIAPATPKIVALRPRIDAQVELGGVGARIVPFEPRQPTGPVSIEDPGLVADGHSAALMLLASGWR